LIASCRAKDRGRALLYRRVGAFPASTWAREFDWPGLGNFAGRLPSCLPGLLQASCWNPFRHMVSWASRSVSSRISSPGMMAALMLPCETVGDQGIFSCKGCVRTQPIEEAPLF